MTGLALGSKGRGGQDLVADLGLRVLQLVAGVGLSFQDLVLLSVPTYYRQLFTRPVTPFALSVDHNPEHPCNGTTDRRNCL